MCFNSVINYIAYVTAGRIFNSPVPPSGHTKSSIVQEGYLEHLRAIIGWLIWRLTVKNIVFLTVNFWSFDG